VLDSTATLHHRVNLKRPALAHDPHLGQQPRRITHPHAMRDRALATRSAPDSGSTAIHRVANSEYVSVGSPMLFVVSVGVWMTAFWSIMPDASMAYVP